MKKRKGWIIAAAIVILFIVLNPSKRRFYEFYGYPNYGSSQVHKTYDFFIFSVFKDDYYQRTYFGILNNFIETTPAKKEGYETLQEAADKFLAKDTTTVVAPIDTVKDPLNILKPKKSKKETKDGFVKAFEEATKTQ